MKKSVVTLLLLCVALLAGVASFGQDPGSTADPLVSKSYLDQVFRFRSIVVPAGDKLPLNAGTMLVIRSGKTRLRSGPKKAVIDLTAGVEIVDGTALPANHLLLVPDSGEYHLEAQALSLVLVAGLNPSR